jgi:hypothetical protein
MNLIDKIGIYVYICANGLLRLRPEPVFKRHPQYIRQQDHLDAIHDRIVSNL